MSSRLQPWLMAAAAAALLWAGFGKALWTPLQDPDLFWQVWAGEQMLEGHFPRTNGLSFTAPDHPWTPHEPLVALTYAAVGLDHVGIVRALVVGCAALLLALLATRRDNAWATLLAIGWCVTLVHFGRSERALSWGNLLAASVVLLTMGKEHRWRLLGATLLVGLWASVHGSFVVGIALVALRSWRWGLAAAALTLVNPSGPKLYMLLLHYGATGGAIEFVHEFIPEWQPPDPTSPATWLRVAFAVAAGWLCVRDRRWRALALWLPLLLLSLRHQRFFDLMGIALLPVVADALARRLPAVPIKAVWLLFAEAWLIAAVVFHPADVDQDLYPTALLQQIPDEARPWHDFQLGGWLGVHGKRAFWDSRNDCYPVQVFEDGYTIEATHDGWVQILEQWDVDMALTRRQTVVDALVSEGWEVRARAGDVTLLVP